MDNRIIYLFHIVIIAPLFIYMWYTTNYEKKKLNESLGVLLLIVGIVLFFYHIYKFVALQRLLSS